LWLVAYPLAWWLAGIAAPLIAAAALLHALLWLRLSYRLRLGSEYRCDERAVELTDLYGYVGALAAYQRKVSAGRRPQVLRARLIRLGLSPEKADALLAE
jgi:hypothetical protein